MRLARLQVPPSARRGAAVEVRVVIQHPMETGFRHDAAGVSIPLNIITKVVCRYLGAEVFRAELGSGIAANPYLAFYVMADRSGDVVVDWLDDHGDAGSVKAALNVTD